MYKGKRIIGIIPARGGSKGLPGKNIMSMNGKPLIAWSIQAGLQSKYLDVTMVTTDSQEIADVAKQYGAAVPFLRPRELAQDHSSTFEAIHHAITFYQQKLLQTFDYIALLEPTSPLREIEDIDKSIEILFKDGNAKAIVSVAKLESGHPEFNVVIDKETGYIRKTDSTTDFQVLRRQDLKDVYFFEGTIYVSEIDTLLNKKTFYHDSTLAYVVPRWKSYEIDELHDFVCVEALLRARLNGLR